MFISHNGDRIVEHLHDRRKVKRSFSVTATYLKQLIQNSDSDNPLIREKTRLYNQPGAYRCSTEELDFIVDTVKNLNGVKGAKLTGAGLGGTVLILVKNEEVENVIDVLEEKYYKPRGLKNSALVCASVNGAEEI